MVRLGMIYQYQKQYDAAEATYIEIIRESPGYSLAHYRLAQLYCGQKQYKKALEEFFLTIKLEPGKTVSVYEQ
ncbi:MAG: tetratricopeptide repeat protein [Candidatus Omnitrophica bacterium]|nr:tetratricopeptide repeat protein [Candidatus Omnitrophota bacterium]